MAKGVLLYIIGVPGSGKTTLVNAFKEGRRKTASDLYCPHIVCGHLEGVGEPDRLPTFVEIGKERDGFSGTDALSMSIQPKALQLLRQLPYKLVIAEGDRLANPGFFRGAEEAGWCVRVILLEVSPMVAATRRNDRASRQNEKWLRGRETKVRNLYPYLSGRINGARGVAEQVDELRALARKELEVLHAGN